MLDALIKGLLLGLYLAVSVGPIVFTVIKQSLDHGWRGGLAFILGIFSVDVFLVICCNAFSHFFSVLLKYKEPLGIAGSILLIAGGVYYLFFKKVETVQSGKEIKIRGHGYYAQLYLTGAVMNILNPGIIAVWFTTATAFVMYTIGQRAVIFGTALLIALSADVAKVLFADKLRRKLTLGTMHRINKINGFIILAFGIVLLILLLWGKKTGH
ncbi:LysE family translocator [Flavisolibacter ginsenosidimutans]|uniref:Lysine transporter LysE n=1 Tax=Flavisolibacter ginsenosidimutans TaxID=661481 RepID=A0A5B8UL64_9BACT|nr:LysE family transporter [Flavisolibacter ginsenosidimutans]QEC57303.1 lysine transporter LysE [Flavisolibacter ginsenosidimutans]